MSDSVREMNLDGLVGPTHHFGGLSAGNLASQRHRHHRAHPKQAALQGLAKMKLLADLGVLQAVLPPHDRPDIPSLRLLGFSGTDKQVIQQAGKEEPGLLSALSSGSSMWAANAATVSPSADTSDRRVHFTPANLTNNLHRRIESKTTSKMLRAIFGDQSVFAHHEPLPGAAEFGDEGAANHMRLTPKHGKTGLEIFVYGQAGLGESATDHPARQTLLASEAVARLHGLSRARTIFIQQNPAAINAGAFHNDVVAVSNGPVVLYHDQSFVNTNAAMDRIRKTYAELRQEQVITIKTSDDELSLTDAIDTYLFNSQLVSLSSSEMALICPVECVEHCGARQVIDRIVAGDNPVQSVKYVDLRQSMQNGGGPACLRLRVALNEEQLGKMHQGVILTPSLYDALVDWVKRHYRDELDPTDLADPKMFEQNRQSLDELTGILGLGSIFRFQRG